MDRNSWIGLVIIIAVLFGWGYFTKPSEEEIAQEKHRRDSIEQVIRTEKLKETIAQEQVKKQEQTLENTAQKSDSIIQQEAQNFYGDFAPFAVGKREFYTLETDLLKITFSNLGGKMQEVQLKKYKRYDGEPLILFSGDSTLFGLNFFSQNRSIATDQLFFQKEIKKVTDKTQVIYQLPLDQSRYIQYIYTISPDSYMVDFDIKFKGINQLISTNTGYLDLKWETYLQSLEQGHSWEQQNTSIYYKFYQDDVENISPTASSASEDLTTKVKWIAYKQQFFNTTIIADNFFSNAVVKTEEAVSPNHLKRMTSNISLPYDKNDEEVFPMAFYFGPNHYKTLKQFDLGLEELVILGRSIIRWINVGFVIPLFHWLGKFIGNFGIIILIITIIIKIIIFPFTYKSYMSSAKMKALKPEVDKLSEKFPKTEDAMKKQQATMALYKKVGVSPMGGCLPLLFQMPLLIAMFRFFPNSIELRQQSFLWATDLSTYDSILNLPFSIPWYGSHVSLFTLLMTIVNLIYIKTNDQMSMSNQQMPGMKLMMYLMPVMMMFWFNSYASALSYYYFISLLITILQTWIIRRTINDEEVLAKLKAAQASKKPVKKSKWQQRMEELAKQRGYKPPKS